ncbi:class I SAM-dependent methyltransferase [Paenibacillus taichungensis]|uniref:class I SAM-dependent methyltransferase n=1 Tax=Paenibacillus taichungensis TaxID=484184 RepID=UPI0038D1F88F
MQKQGSYNVSTIAINLDKEINRLGAQVELFWEQELKHYIEYGLKDGMNVVELGSGPGFVTGKLLDYFPKLHVTALEIDSILVDYANNYLSNKHHSNYTVIEGSILETRLPDNTFDFAITRLVLEHLSDPIGAIKETLRILKPGGRAIFIDNDFEMHIMTFPPIPELRELYDAYCQSRLAEGGNPRIGRELPILLKAGGFKNVGFEVICAHSGILGEDKFLNSEGIGIPSKLVRDGFLSSKTLGAISVAWRNMLHTEEHSIMRQLYLGYGEK